MSIQIQQSALSYHLGVRESFGMKGNILMHNDVLAEQTLRLKVYFTFGEPHLLSTHYSNCIRQQISCSNYTFLPYVYQELGATCIVTHSTKESSSEHKQTLIMRLKKLLQDVEIQSK